MHTRELGIGMLMLATVGCGHPKVGGPVGTGASTSMMIMASTGGTVSLEGTTLAIPAGALPDNTVITITSTTSSPPSNYKSWSSPVFQFGPDGLVFLRPVQVTLTFTGNPASPTVRWSNANGGFDNLGGAVEGDHIIASVVHFSQGFVTDKSLLNEPDGGVVAMDAPIQDGPRSTPPPDSGGTPPPDGGMSTFDGGTLTPDSSIWTSDGGIWMPDGGISPPDGGLSTSDGGMSTSDGATPPPDGGITTDGGHVSPPDSGITTTDGGATSPPDGGISTSDGGTPASDGGAPPPVTAPDAGP